MPLKIFPLIAWFAVVFLVALSVCAAPVYAAPSKTVIVLFDISESTKTPGTREQYQKDFKKILDAIAPGDAIAADRIAEASAAGSTLPINEEFEGLLNSNRFKVNKKKSDIQGKVVEVINQKQKVGYTDILGSLQIAERVFQTYGKERNILVIMSDMIEDSASYNFTKEQLTDKRITEIIAREKQKNQLPDLSNVEVYAVKTATSQSRDTYVTIQNFWLQYFKACGARVDKAHYGPLTKFE